MTKLLASFEGKTLLGYTNTRNHLNWKHPQTPTNTHHYVGIISRDVKVEFVIKIDETFLKPTITVHLHIFCVKRLYVEITMLFLFEYHELEN